MAVQRPWTRRYRPSPSPALPADTTPPEAPVAEIDPPPAKQPATPDEAQILGGRYRLDKVLGSGGEAVVHLARDLVLDRDVAVKMFRGHHLDGRDRLQQAEARVAAALNHYALTSLFDAGIDDVIPDQGLYLVMEYVRGESLRARLQRTPLSVADVCWMGFDLAEGLDYMHQSGFLHRDVKPENVMISGLRSVRPVVAKLTDFGIATPVGQPDLSEFTVGSAAYLSPEQVEGEDASPASDIYSLGLVMLEAMTGRVEFRGTIEQAAFARLVHDPAIPDSLPSAVSDLLRRMTARAPEQRVDLYTVAIELQQFLASHLVRQLTADQPPQTDHPGPPIPTPPESLSTVVLNLLTDSLQIPAAMLVTHETDQPSTQHVGFDGPDQARALAALLVQPPPPGGSRVRRIHAADSGFALVAAAVVVRGQFLGYLCAVGPASDEFSPRQQRILLGLTDLLSADLALRAAMRDALLAP